MRSLALTLALITLQLAAGCATATTVASADSPKGPVLVALDAKNDSARVVFGDSKYKIHLRGVNDSRCPANAKCIWQGELAAQLDVDRDTAGSKESKRFTLGEVTAPSITILGASFELVSITESSVTFRVTGE